MEWAEGFVVGTEGLQATLIDTGGERRAIPVSQLYRDGLPEAKSLSRSLTAIQFCELKVVQPHEYLNAFGVETTHADAKGV